MSPVYIGIAGWSISRDNMNSFPLQGSHLERYASVFNAVEINSSFKKEHLGKTYERWARSVPSFFRFSVKLSRRITHKGKLENSSEEIRETILPILDLESKLGVILLQLPPKLAFHEGVVDDFFYILRSLTKVAVVCEPRHESWLCPKALEIFKKYGISKVIADPAPCPDTQGLFQKAALFDYYRLHGSPKMYSSSYGEQFLKELFSSLRPSKISWIIFDNTAEYHAVPNAIEIKKYSTTLPSLNAESI
jgi:uncharacterized protein YecE (DUF72 family)